MAKFIVVFYVSACAFLLSVCLPRVNAVVVNSTVHILSDGSVDSPAVVRNGDLYTFVDDLNITSHADGVEIERDNIVLDGAGHTVMGIGEDDGIHMAERNNVTVKNITIINFYWGMYLSSSANCWIFDCIVTDNDWFGIRIDQGGNHSIFHNTITRNVDNAVDVAFSAGNHISENTITFNNDAVFFNRGFNNTVSNNLVFHNDVGVYLWDGTNRTTVFGNNITENGWGVAMYNATENTIAGNEITDGYDGVYVELSSGNTIYHNNFVNNTDGHVYDFQSSNVWDDGYPSGGNYWSNYTGTDNNNDGIGETPHVLDASNQDRYPLTARYVIPELSPTMIYVALALITSIVVCTRWQKLKQRPHPQPDL